MKTAKAASTERITQGLAKGHCPVCALLAEFQEQSIEGVQTADISHLCNYHAWALAKAAPADTAARIFIHLVDRSQGSLIPSKDSYCDFCEKIHQQEIVRVEEMIRQFKRANVQEWVKLQGSFCLAHAKKLGELLPADLRALVLQVMNRNRFELKEELSTLLAHLRQGDRTGWGVLGRAAEFLTSQRGITR